MRARLQPIFMEPFIYGTLSQKRKGGSGDYDKVQVRPFRKGDALLYQFTYVFENRVTHENLAEEAALLKLEELLTGQFLQAMLYTAEHDYHLLSFARLKIKTLPPSKEPSGDLSHDKQKNYILKPDGGYDFLIRLGVMSSEGRVYKQKYDKFRQINKYLELVATSMEALPGDRTLNIVDFGCGKAYLTFALYYYLVEVLGRDVRIVGLDLKEDVVRDLQVIGRDLGYENLDFLVGDIKHYENSFDTVDMVVTLHACDTATDDAIVKAVEWDTKVLLTVPCCQHELFDQLESEHMLPILRHGILKERQSALVTDALRGQLLEACGYDVSVMEFIEMEHTPKNLLIRALRTGKGYNKSAFEGYIAFKKFWSLAPYLEAELRAIGAFE